MNNCEILRKSYLKAMENGFRGYSDLDRVIFSNTLIIYDKEQIFRDNFMPSERDWYSILGLVFDHNFAKAFWGEEYNNKDNPYDDSKIWEYHLQKMVVVQEPLKYLEKFL
jgi:hypothetical protein